jgi:hypothetical protein
MEKSKKALHFHMTTNLYRLLSTVYRLIIVTKTSVSTTFQLLFGKIH